MIDESKLADLTHGERSRAPVREPAVAGGGAGVSKERPLDRSRGGMHTGGTFDWAAVLERAAQESRRAQDSHPTVSVQITRQTPPQPQGGVFLWGIVCAAGLAVALLLFYWWSS